MSVKRKVRRVWHLLRSSITGRWVTPDYLESHKDTTTAETVIHQPDNPTNPGDGEPV